MGQEDVLVEVIINGKDMLQFFSTKENYKTLFEDRDALVDTVKTAFKEGILYSADITNVEDIHSVQFLSEVADVTVEASAVEQVVQEGEQYETYEIIEEPIDSLTSNTIPEELIIDVGLTSGASHNQVKDSSSSDENALSEEPRIETNGGALNENMETENIEISPMKGEYVEEDTSYVDDEMAGIKMAEAEKQQTQESETIEEVVSEEVVTTPVDGQYEIIEYEEGEVKGVIHSGETGSPKSKNLSFLNKKQTEKLREFKRLLQEGTKLNQNSSSNGSQEEGSQTNVNGDVDNISENTESCTEEPCLDEDLQDTSAIQNEENNYQEKPDEQPVEIQVYENETMTVNQLAEDSSVLIVEHTDPDQEEYEIYDCVVETIEEPETESEGSPVIACELCGFETYSVKELKIHIGTHTGETAPPPKTITPSYFSCDKCAFRAIRKIDVGRHKALFHGGTLPQRLPFVCGKCNFRAAGREEFVEHLASHQTETASIKCKICELKVLSEEELKHHSRNHIGEEPFECYFCAYLTARKCHLRNHMKRRHNMARNGGKGPPYECYTCGYETTERTDFHNHIGKHKSEGNKTYKCQFDRCRFLTLDLEVFKKHVSIHSNNGRKETDLLEAQIANISRDVYSNDVTQASDGPKKFKRIPLKEYGNLPESDRNKLFLGTSTSSTIAPAGLLKKLIKEENSLSPLKKKRRGLRSFNPEDSLIENRLSRKFNFNPKNLVSSPKRTESGFNVEMVGEVYKSHGSLRKFVNYGDVVKKSDKELAVVLSHPESDAQLRVVFNQLKDMISSLKEKEPDVAPVQLNIFFKEIDDVELKLDETLSDIDIDISSDEDGSRLSMRDLGSDIDLDDLSDVESLVDMKSRESSPEKKPIKVSSNGIRKETPEIIIDLDGDDKLQFIQEKIRERNEKRKELRRLKALNVTLEKKGHRR